MTNEEKRIHDGTLCLTNDQEAYMAVTETASRLAGILKNKYELNLSPEEAEAAIRDAITYLVDNGAAEQYEPKAV